MFDEGNSAWKRLLLQTFSDHLEFRENVIAAHNVEHFQHQILKQ